MDTGYNRQVGQVAGCPVNNCGEPPFSNANSLCEKHFASRYVTTYERLKREIRCPNCTGSGVVFNLEKERKEICEKCDGRGWIDPKRIIAYAQPEPAPRTVDVPEGAKKKFFDPGVTVDTETGEITEPIDRTEKGLGF